MGHERHLVYDVSLKPNCAANVLVVDEAPIYQFGKQNVLGHIANLPQPYDLVLFLQLGIVYLQCKPADTASVIYIRSAA